MTFDDLPKGIQSVTKPTEVPTAPDSRPCALQVCFLYLKMQFLMIITNVQHVWKDPPLPTYGLSELFDLQRLERLTDFRNGRHNFTQSSLKSAGVNGHMVLWHKQPTLSPASTTR